MLNLLVLILSAGGGSCFTVTPEMLVPIKQFNEACGYEACPVPMSETGINVHIVPHTHYELAFGRTFAEHYTGKDGITAPSKINMKQTLDSVVTELWMNSNRRFALSDIAYFFHWWSQRDQTVRQMVYSLIRQGRLVFVGGGWSMHDEATTSYQAIIDSFTYSLRFDALFVNPISFDDELARMRRWALEMLWRGSDDLGPQTDIYTHKLFDGYWSPPGFCFSSLCSDPLIVTSDSVLTNVEERAKEFMDSIYNRQAPNYNTSHVMVTMGHINGYFDAPMWFANIDALIKAVNARAKFGKQKMYLMYSTPACYAKAVHDSDIPLETKQDDFYPYAYDKNSYLTGLYTSSPSLKVMAREATVYLQMCKQMRVLAELGPEHNNLFEELNWIMGVFQDHTVITGALADRVKSYYVHKMYVAVQRATVLLRQAWNKLRQSPEETIYYRCSFNVSRCHQLVGDTYFVQIYNPLAWAVTMPVRIPLQYFGTGFQVFDPKDNIIKSAVIKIPYPVLNIHSRVNASNCEVVFIAENLPPLGFRSYFIKRNPPETTKTKLETTKTKRETTKPKREATKPKRETTKPKRETTKTKRESTKTKRKTTKPKRESTKTKRETTKTQRESTKTKRETTKTKRETTYKRSKRTIIKNMNRKPNKKYLIRQANPTIEDQTLLDDTDYEYESTTYAADSGNITMLLESDTDEVKMQQILESDFESSSSSVILESSSFIPTAKSTIIKVNDDDEYIKPKHWNKVVMGRRKGVDDVIESIIPSRTTTMKAWETATASEATTTTVRTTTTDKIVQDGVATEVQKKENKEIKKVEETTVDKEGDISESILDHTRMTSEGEISAEDFTENPAKVKEVIQISEDIMEPSLNVTTTEATYTIDVVATDKATNSATSANANEYVTTTDKQEAMHKQLQEDLLREMKHKMFDVGNINNTYIENKYIRITIDPASSKISAVTLSNGVHIDLDIQFYFYAADDPVALNKPDIKKPGAYLFRAIENTAIPILDYIDIQVHKTPVVEEAHLVYSDWTSFVVRLYDESPVIEVEWLVGPIPVEDKLGKEVFIRYLSNLVHDGVFYTDSNGRQTIKRIRNLRPMYDSLNTDQVAGNFYPVTSRIAIQDLNSRICLSVFPDRAQGGASLADGEIDLMLYRRILTDDTGAGTFVNDTEYGIGAVARGKHYLYISKIDYKPYRIFEKKFAKEIQLAPQVLVSRPDPYGARAKETWSKSKNEISFLKTKLPIGIHLLTLEHWNDDTLLLRLENILEKSDTVRGQIKTVFIKELFTNIYINNVKETTLAANMWLEEHKPWQWMKKENFVKSFNEFYGVDKEAEFLKDEKPVAFEDVDLNKGITLSPQQIRTFVCWFDYVEV